MKIYSKLIVAFSAVALICAIVGLIGWYGINKTEKSLIEVGGTHLPTVKALGLVMEGMYSIKMSERTLINPKLTIDDRGNVYNLMNERWSDLQKGWESLTASQLDPAERAQADKVQAGLAQLKKEHGELVDQVQLIDLDNIETLNSILLARQLDHLHWVEQLAAAIATGEPFRGQLDPALCGLGHWLEGYESSSDNFQEILDKLASPHEELHTLGAKVNKLLAAGNKNQAGQVLRQEVRPTLAEIEEVFTEARAYVGSQLEILREAEDIAFVRQRATFSQVMSDLNKLYEMASQLATDSRIQAADSARHSKQLALLAVLLGIIVAIGLGAVSAREISRPMVQGVKFAEEIARGLFTSRLHLKRTDEIGQFGQALDHMADNLARKVEAAKVIAQGDLTGKIVLSSADDALGQALQTMQRHLYDTISQTKLASNEIASGSMQIADSSQVLAQGASEQASSLEEISSAMTEMASQTKMTAENAAQARNLSDAARQAGEKGNQQMRQMVLAMDEIRNAGQKVSNVIKVIDEIAFQTNMLALNAAVEAAHAGQHGKGFAVVAEEVRNLAARSAKAAKETEELIAGSVDKTENGAQIADQTAAALDEIVSGVAQAADLVGNIAEAAREQSLGIDQVTQALGQIDQVTQQNSATAEEAAAAAEELSGQAAQLQQLLQKFKVETAGRQKENMQPNSHPQEVSNRPTVRKGPAAIPPPNPGREGDPPDPSRIIPLDDGEFGRY